MKKTTISLICVIGSLLIILASLDAIHWLILLLLAGVVPGTNIIISPIDMMAASATAIAIVILRLALWPALSALSMPTIKPNVVIKKPSSRRIV